MNRLYSLLKKEFLQEVRSKEVSAAILALSLLLSVLAAIGIQLSFLNMEQVIKIAPLLIWLIFLFSATSGLSRSFDCEIQHGAVDGLKLAAVPFPLVFVAKVLAAFVILFFSHIVSCIALFVLLDLSVEQLFGRFLLLSAVVIVAYASLAILFAAVAATSKMRGLLLPLILFPLLFPLFFAALEVTAGLLGDAAMAGSSFWFAFAGLLAVIYFLLGLNLYQYVAEE